MANITSCVPQGILLGPILFLIHINDRPNEISSHVKLFADEAKVYRKLSDLENDRATLQSDLDCMSVWTKLWQ